MLNVVDAVTTHRVCACDCFATLPLAERVVGVRAVYKLDDALRGWGYTPIYDGHGDRLWREAQQKNDASYRAVAVRFGECIYRRLLGSLIHECIHAICGDVSRANYGVLFGLPYAVPQAVAAEDEKAFLEPFNFGEARAWVGVWIVGRRMFGLDWDLRTARDIGTYCFVGGNALVPAIAGYRPVAHIDRQHHPERYYARGRKLEERARAWFDADGNLKDWWGKDVNAEFERRADCVKKQYDGYVVLGDVHVNGKLTLGENIADLGGLKLAYTSMKTKSAARPGPGAKGELTADQEYFLGFAQAWCGKMRDEALRHQVATNPHSPPNFRVNGPISNTPEFARAFNCKPDAKMVRKDRCEVW